MSGQQEVLYIEVGGLRRRYALYRPDAVVRGGERVPAIMMLDGRGGTPWTAMRSTQWNPKADQEGFVMIYPEAMRVDPEGPLHFLTNPQMWNAGVGGSDVERPAVDDVSFLAAVLDDAAGHARIDRARIFMTGFSNGAAMTYRFALAHPDRLAAMAPVAGHLRNDEEALREPIPMISLYGRLDPLNPYEGGEVDLPWGRREWRPPAVKSIHNWARLCGHDPAHGVWSKGDGFDVLSYGATGNRDEIQFMVVTDLGHVWPGGHRLLPESLVGATSSKLGATEEIWDFFRRHRR